MKPYYFRSVQPALELKVSEFKGVDFSTNPTKVDFSRSPDALNMIADERFFPIKRMGYQKVTELNEPVYGLHHYVKADRKEVLLIHCGSSLYALNEENEAELLFHGMAENTSNSFNMNGSLYLLDGSTYRVYDGETVTAVADTSCYIPTTLYGAYPNGAKPEGSVYIDEPVNFLSKWQKNKFIADGGIRQTEVIELWSAPTANGALTVTAFGLSFTVSVTANESIASIAEKLKARFVGGFQVETSAAFDIIKLTITADFPDIYTPATISFGTTGAYGTAYLGESGMPGCYEYHTSGGMIDQDSVVTVKVDGMTKNSGVEWDDEYLLDYIVHYDTGVIEFRRYGNAWEIPAPAAAIGGIPNVEITFAKTIEKYADTINKCTICGVYGGNIDMRVFLSGNPQLQNSDFQSGLYDPTYFGDTSYTKVGSDRSAIVGYHKMHDMQLIIKEDNEQDVTQYLRTYEIDAEGKAKFPLRQGANAYGAVSKQSFAVLNDVPLFLSRHGVIGIRSTSIAQQTNYVNMSRLVNNRMLRETDLSTAVCTVFDDKYMVAVGGNCYVADGKQMYFDNGPQFEWYFWDNIPATCFVEYQNSLYFGTSSGVFRFYNNTDRKDETGWQNEMVYQDNGQAIHAYWATPLTPFNEWSRLKSVLNFYVAVMPHARSSVKVYYFDENNFAKITDSSAACVLDKKMDLFDLSNLDFSRFTFKMAKTPTPFSTSRKAKNIYLFQAVMQNNALGEPFGILSYEIRYQYKKFIK